VVLVATEAISSSKILEAQSCPCWRNQHGNFAL
jgi:hypothetical protein